MITRLRDLSASLDLWVAQNRRVSTAVGAALVVAAVVMIFLNESGVIDGPLQYVSYLVMGLGIALIVIPRTVSNDPDQEDAL